MAANIEIDTVTGDKLICDFMDHNYLTESPRYTSWDWLMPVIEKIENAGAKVFIDTERTRIEINNQPSISCNYGYKLINTYKAVLEFIELAKQPKNP